MRIAGLCVLVFAILTGVVSAKPIDGENMVQPGAPVRVVGCSAEPMRLHNGMNVREHASFEVTGPSAATAVRVGFAFFDTLGGRSIRNVVMSGTFSPGTRIDMPESVGRIGNETKGLVCFALQASFANGTQWHIASNGYPSALGGAQVDVDASIPTEIVASHDAPMRFDRCVMRGPENEMVTTAILLTNTGERPLRRVDVAYVFYGASGSISNHHQWKAGDFPPGAVISASLRLAATDSSYAKITCALQRVTFADGSVWTAPAAPSAAAQ